MESNTLAESKFVRNFHEKALEKFINEVDVRMDFQHHRYCGITLVKINLSRAVMCESQTFYKFLFNLIDEGANKIIIDLTSLEFIDSSFAGVLVAALRRVRNRKGDIRLVLQPGNSLSNQMFFNGMVKIYKTYSTTKEALNSYECSHENSMSSVSHLSSQK
ncbi:MAG: STAS domain-containing protein [Ignavibacteriaceae bacterium]|jgi:anti-sigma B factor antagonist